MREDDKTQAYADVIMDHAKAPRHYGAPTDAKRRRLGVNPLCGDEVELFLTQAEGGAQVPHFVSKGCALCRASASLMISALVPHPVATWRDRIAAFARDFARGERPAADDPVAPLFDLLAYPSRAKCVLLPWETLDALLSSKESP